MKFLIASFLVLVTTVIVADEKIVVFKDSSGSIRAHKIDTLTGQITPADVIVDSSVYGGGVPVPPPGDDNPPVPGPTDPEVKAIADISKAELNLEGAKTMLALFLEFKKRDVTGDNLKLVLDIALPKIKRDKKLDVTGWYSKILKLGALKPDKIIDGLASAFGLDITKMSQTMNAALAAVDSGLNSVQAAQRATPETEEVFDIIAILEIVRMVLDILDLLKDRFSMLPAEHRDELVAILTAIGNRTPVQNLQVAK